MTTDKDLRMAILKARLRRVIEELQEAENPFYSFIAWTCRDALRALESKPKRVLIRRKR